MEVNLDDVTRILIEHKITPNNVVLFQSNNRITDYIIDQKFILRLSKSKLIEQSKLEKVQLISFVQKIHASGETTISETKLYYMITDFVVGNELFSEIPKLTSIQQRIIGKEIAEFLNELHQITDTYYDIGHYIPTILRFNSSWKEGHIAYLNVLKRDLSGIGHKQPNQDIIQSALHYIESNIDCLEYQTGPRLLHNDLHPKNIIVDTGRLAGIIDWECSQYGEADFELAHLFHWCIYPPHPEEEFNILLQSILENCRFIQSIPNLEKRLTIYQLEHELNQMIWSGMEQVTERSQRIEGWLNGKIEKVIHDWK